MYERVPSAVPRGQGSKGKLMEPQEHFGVMEKEEVEKRFPGAYDRLLLQRHSNDHGVTVKVSALGRGGWLFGLKDNKLFLFNSVFHGTKIGGSTYKTLYEWTGAEWKYGAT
jgi:hypothetical protein